MILAKYDIDQIKFKLNVRFVFKCHFALLGIDPNRCVAYLHIRFNESSLGRMRGLSEGRILGECSVSKYPVEQTHIDHN